MKVSKDRVHVQRRRAAGAGLAALLLVSGMALASCMDEDREAARLTSLPQDEAGVTSGGVTDDAGATSASDDAAVTSEPVNPLWQREPMAAEHPSDATAMTKVDYLTEFGTPKSVMSSEHGLLITNNMMYSHTATVFDAETREIVTILDDGVDLEEFGVEGHPGTSQGSPVEAAWTKDGRYAYVSNYTMYGTGFGREGFDACTSADGVGNSFLYRFDAEELAWDQVIEVGAVPKYLALSPDDSTILVSNWCGADLSVVDTEKAKERDRITLDESPRGIAVMPDGKTAYVTAMYGDKLYKLDYSTGEAEIVMETGVRPRHLNLSPDGRYLYLTTSSANLIQKIDTKNDEVVDEVSPGAEPRSVAMSPDGKALYVVNYNESTVAKVRTSDMEVIDRQPTDGSPIGIDYDPVTNTVWVACYNGSMFVFDDQKTLLPDA